MRHILLLFLLAVATTGFSQLVVESNFDTNGLSSDASIAQTFTVTNQGTTTANFYWQLIRPAEMPREWTFTICDAILCYAEGVEASACNDPQYINVIAAGASITYFKVGLHPHGVEGNHTVQMRFTEVCDNITDEDIIATTQVTFGVEGTSSINDTKDVAENILIYPNPTTDRFQVKNDEGVSQLAIYNIVGKKIVSSTHKAGQSHDISDLEKGIYLVRMLDNKGKSLKVIRLTKD